MESEAAAGAPVADQPSETTPVEGLHSPPDSNGPRKAEGSESELSDVEDPTDSVKICDDDLFKSNSHGQCPATEQEEDIGEILPAEWSGTVPVFRPTMKQFKDFKQFVSCSHPHFIRFFYILQLTQK